MSKHGESSGFYRTGKPNVEDRTSTVVPFDETRVDEAIRRGALRLEHARTERNQPHEQRGPEPTLEEMESGAEKILQATQECDIQLRDAIVDKFSRQDLQLKDYVQMLQHMDEDDVSTNEEYCNSIATIFKRMNAARQHGDRAET